MPINPGFAIDISQELGRLLVHVAEVAIAIRLNSPYRSDYKERDPHEVGFDVLHLSESLHCLERLGMAAQSGNSGEIIAACDALLDYYRMYTDDVPEDRAKVAPRATFERYSHLCHPQEAMSIFTDIRTKARALGG